jgi:tRNA (guanine-N7-)-methyltransferase
LEFSVSRGRHPRRIKSAPPDEATAKKYLFVWQPKDLYHHRESYPIINSQNFFANDRPLELEVGCGVGEFLCDLALSKPLINFIGIELSFKSIYKAVEIAADLGLDNIRFIRADVRLTYPLWPSASLQTIYLHFPDPCYKKKYRKNRILNEAFLDLVYRTLQPGGQFSVMTDQEPFFMDMLALVEADNRFEKLHDERFLIGFEEGLKSRYQKIWESRGLTTRRFLLQKPPDDPAVEPAAAEEIIA